MVIVCRGCGARFRMTHALFQDAKGARIRCRKCSGYIEVRHPEAKPPPLFPRSPAHSGTSLLQPLFPKYWKSSPRKVL